MILARSRFKSFTDEFTFSLAEKSKISSVNNGGGMGGEGVESTIFEMF